MTIVIVIIIIIIITITIDGALAALDLPAAATGGDRLREVHAPHDFIIINNTISRTLISNNKCTPHDFTNITHNNNISRLTI